MSQSNLINSKPKDFFDGIEPVTHCLNICMICTFDLVNHTVCKIELHDKYNTQIDIPDLSDLNKLAKYLDKKYLINRQELYKNLKLFFKDLQSKHSLLTLPPEQIKLVLVVDVVNTRKPYVKHWTSLPILGGSQEEVAEYFNGISQLAYSTLTTKEKAEFQILIDKISKKVLNKEE
jgi:hypothetical protein